MGSEIPRTFEHEFDDASRRILGNDLSRIHDAAVMVLGAGALGNEVLKNLALYNVGKLYICDLDTVEWANLSHSVLFRESDDGKPKVEAAERALREINRLIKVKTHYGPLSDIGLGVWRSVDVVVGCLDNRGSRLLIDRACARAGKDWIDAGLGSLTASSNPMEGIFQGLVQVFSPRNGFRYENYLQTDTLIQMAEKEAADSRKAWRNWPGCSEMYEQLAKTERVPTTPTMSSLIGALQAQETIRCLCPDAWGFEGLQNRCLTVNAARFGFDVKINPRSAEELPLYPITEVPEWRAKSTTVGDVVERAKQDLGPHARVKLGFQFCVGLECSVCHKVDHRPFKLGSRDEVCPDCKIPRRPLADSVMPDHLNGSEEFPELPLSALGVPLFDVLEACAYEQGRTGQKPRLIGQCNYELTGDREEALGW